MQSLREIEIRASAVGDKIWCLCVFVALSRFESGALYVRGVHSSNDHFVAVYGSIFCRVQSFLCVGIGLSNA